MDVRGAKPTSRARSPTSIEDGIARFVDWYRSFYADAAALAAASSPA